MTNYALAAILFALAAILWLSAPSPEVAPMRLVAPRGVALEQYRRSATWPSIDSAIRDAQAERAANPEAFRRWRECRERCGYAPRPEDPGGEVSAEYAAEIQRRRAACGRIACL